MLGSIDFATDFQCAHTREALLFARSGLVLASRLVGAPAPLDGITTTIKDPGAVREDAAYALSLAFAGKLGTIQMVSARMNERRRMRWSPRCAHRVLQVRAAVLDGRFGHPAFQLAA